MAMAHAKSDDGAESKVLVGICWEMHERCEQLSEPYILGMGREM